jgi:hypothetical protein
MSKFIKLLTAAIVNGTLRHPREGVLHLENDEAQRLLDDKAGVDVTSDFSADERKETPVESVTVQTGQPAAPQSFDPVAENARVIAEHLTDDGPKPAAKPPAKKAD